MTGTLRGTTPDFLVRWRSNFVTELDIEDVTVWRLDEHGQLETKIEVERTHPQSKYLLYAPFVKPDNADNWLLDILLYSEEFRADRASVLLNELGLEGPLPSLSKKFITSIILLST